MIRPEEPIVRLEGVSKRFPLRRGWKETVLHPRRTAFQEALVDVTLEVRRGEVFGLLGRNGAGKTTLFKILATLVLPDAGSVRVAGENVVRRPDAVRRRLVPVIPYERSLYWRLCARENLRLYAVLQGFGGKEAYRRMERVLEVVGLADTGGKQVGLFSSGMKQRLLIARALLSDPEVLLLDEPTRSLDPITAKGLRSFLRDEINGGRGCTLLLATHDAEEVRELCHRVAILDRGRVLATGIPAELLSPSGEIRYRLVARGLLESDLRALEGRGLLRRASPCRTLEDGWRELELGIAGGRPAVAGALRELLTPGVEVASLGERELKLAELIESVVERNGREAGR